MKKTISMLVAFAAAASLSLASFAADDTPGELTEFSGDTAQLSRTASITPFIGTNVAGDMVVGANELILVDIGSNVVGGLYNHLIPDKEYKFRIYYNTTDAAITATDSSTLLSNAGIVELTGAHLDKANLRLRTKKGSSYVSSAKIRSIGRGGTTVYDLVIDTRAQYGTNMSDAEYILAISGTPAVIPDSDPAANYVISESQHSFEIGWPTIDDDETDVGEDGILVISNEAPVITKDQFADISRSANYKNVNFEGEDGGWKFTGRTSGMSSSNFFYTYDVIPEIINKLPDQDYKFLSFKGGVTFPTNGELRIDSSDVSPEFSAIYTYLYRNGRLTEVNTTYDNDTGEMVFRTNYLGSFILTDTRITDTSIVGEPEENNEDEEDNEDENNVSGTDNPSTGAAGVDMGVTLALATLVAAGAISRKRK